MKRRRTITLAAMMGLAVVLAVVLLATLVGPASAATGTRVDFQATAGLSPCCKDSGGDPSDPSQWLFYGEWDGPNGLHCTYDWLWEGQYLLPVDGTGSIPFLTGYLYDHVNAVDERDSSGNLLWGFRFHEGMLHVGCDSLADVTYATPIWKVYCVGKMEADGTTGYTSVAYGVAGAVRGWEAHWTSTVNLETGLCDISGYYVTQ
jgi:hypothetical protein